MVKVKVGERTRQLITDPCKPLFYENGIAKTTFGMICYQGDVAPGSITYHFSSKAEIAAIIANEFGEKLQERISETVPIDSLEHWTGTYLVVKSRWYVLLQDSNLRRFYREVYNEEAYTRPVVHVLMGHRPFVSREITNEDLLLNVATIVGQDRMVLDLVDRYPEIYSYEKITNYTVQTFFRLLDLDRETTEKAVTAGNLYFQRVQNTLSRKYFENFLYHE